VRVSRWARVRLNVSIATGAIGLVVGAGYALYAHPDSLFSHLAWTAVAALPVYALAVLTDGGLVAAVEARAGRLPLGVTVHADAATRNRRFGPDIEAAAYFVACEALTNVVKHAGASQAVVSFTAADGSLCLKVRDDGAGLNGSGTKGHGLTNLRDRVEALGGHLLVEGGPDGGTSLSAALPIGTDDA